MDDPAGRFSGLFSCEPADNPFLIAGLPALNLSGDCFVRQVEKGRERWGFRQLVVPRSIPMLKRARIMVGRLVSATPS